MPYGKCSIPIEHRLFSKVKFTNSCWIWEGPVDSRGYGQIGRCQPIGGLALTHRVSWELFNGKIPKGKFILHKCDIPLCINPEHLFLGTNKDNMRDMLIKGRAANRNGKQKLTIQKAEEIRKLHFDEKIKIKDLCILYKVSRSVINGVVYGTTYKTNN